MSQHSSTSSSPLLDSPRPSTLSDVPEEPAGLTSPGRVGSPYTQTFRAHASTSSLTSVASAAKAPSGPRHQVALRIASSSSLRAVQASPQQPAAPPLDEGDRSSIAAPSVAGLMMTANTPRAKSPATIRERRERRGGARDKEEDTPVLEKGVPPRPRYRETPRVPSSRTDVELAPATLMYWSRAPVYGFLPTHGLRAHTATLLDGVAWIFGGCDEKGCWKDAWCFHTETMQWTYPQTLGEVPPPCRAHTATLVDQKIVMIGGGEGPYYYNDVYVLDTVTRRWARPTFKPASPLPPPRRAHTTVLYRNRIWVFGGGNGTMALNDLWTLEVGSTANVDRMRWDQVTTKGKRPTARGYHTANLVGNVMVVIGGSDGRECFSDVWCLNLDTLVWSKVSLNKLYRRLSHTATQVGSYLFVWGGHDGTSYTSDLLMFNLVSLTYEHRAVAGRSPSARGYHTALLADSRVFVIGGFNGGEVFDDVHMLELAGAAYLPQVTSFKIDVE